MDIYIYFWSISLLRLVNGSPAPAMHYTTASEKDNTFVRSCPPAGAPLFPLDRPPQEWPSCHDAYEVTWGLDVGKHLVGLTETQRLKLSHSMGFCPHLRCQLGMVGNSAHLGLCPEGLCYTKQEAGAPTFGACCFNADGVFNSGAILGYYRLLRATPKPIYKRNRVVLGGDPSDESEASFINANEVHPGIIVTQCPIMAASANTNSTLNATERMLQEQEVRLVIQVDPFVDGGESLPLDTLLASTSRRGCGVWPVQAYASKVYRHDPKHCLVEFRYVLGGREVRHLWYYCWRDFGTPRAQDAPMLRAVAEEASQVIWERGKVVLTCHAGRGRSGTLAAIIVGFKDRLWNNEELIDAIVKMRESRDGLLETPEQYAFVRQVLSIGPKDPGGALEWEWKGLVALVMAVSIAIGLSWAGARWWDKQKQVKQRVD